MDVPLTFQLVVAATKKMGIGKGGKQILHTYSFGLIYQNRSSAFSFYGEGKIEKEGGMWSYQY